MACSVTVVLFEGFELLDVFGPVALFSRLPEHYRITYAAEQPGLVRSSQGAQVMAETALRDTPATGILLVPGGIGTRTLVSNAAFLHQLHTCAQDARIIASVCTGSALLAAAGLLDGYRATSNKKAFTWASSQGHGVTWVPVARWVEDRGRWTSSGVAAGIDMTAALIARLSGAEAAATAAQEIEVELHTKSTWDPFASLYGLA